MADSSAVYSSDEPHAVLLDVGHGNAAVFFDGDTAVVVDAGSGGLVTDTLERHGVSDIAALIISHQHHDHTSELPALLSSRDHFVRRLFVNSDAFRDPTTHFEEQLLGAMNDSFQRNGTELQQVNVTLGAGMGTERLEVQVLWPNVELALRGVGGASKSSKAIKPHEMAVALRVASSNGRSVLLLADLDHTGIQTLINDSGADLSSDLVVYPHHGGLTGMGDAEGESRLAADLARAVDPDVVVFSNGRGRHGNPRPDVIRGVRAARDSPKIRVVCTQLSERCSADTDEDPARLDPTLDSAGASEGLSCAGSIRVALGGGPLLPRGVAHMDFVINKVGSGALCARDFASSPMPSATAKAVETSSTCGDAKELD